MNEKLSVIFNAFRTHIVDICDNKSMRYKYIECKDQLKKATLFTRNRVWTFRVLVQAIMACFRRTLTVDVMEFLENEKLPQTTPEAYIIRRKFVSSKLFRDLNTWLLKTADERGIFPKWHKDKYLLGIDGTRLSLPYTPELYKLYRQRDDNEKGYNLGRGVFVTDLVSRTILSANLVANRKEERKAALELLTEHDFPIEMQSAVFVMDRGYPSLQLMNWFHANTGGFIIRARRDTNPQIAEFMDSDQMESPILLKLSNNRRDIDYAKPSPLTVRLVKRPYRKDEEDPVVLITDLDSDKFPAEKIIEAYRMRWHVETEIGTAKNELQIELFSGLKDICIQQDFFAAILMYNIETLIRIPVNKMLANRDGKHKFQVNMNCTWFIVQTLIEKLYKPPEDFDKFLTFSVKYFLRVQSIERPGRSSPRIRRSIKTSGKFQTLTNYKRGL